MTALGAAALFALALAESRFGADGVDRARADVSTVGTGSASAPGRRPNLVLIVIDTLREDCLRPERMPNLSRIAAEGVSFRNAASTAPWTLPSVASVLTGLLPSRHGNLDQMTPVLPASVPTYAEVLSRVGGYETVACVGSVWFGDRETLLQGFDQVGREFHLQGIDTFLGGWAERRDARRPFFLLLHTCEAHDPYGAANHPWPPSTAPAGPLPASREPIDFARAFFLDGPERDAFVGGLGQDYIRSVVRYLVHDYAEDPQPAFVEEIHDAYDDGVRFVDDQIGRAVERLARLRLLENTLLVVVGDHGEGFAEHGQLGHGHQLYDELVHVPLVLCGPAPFRGGLRPEASVSLMDVLPTFLEWAGMPELPETDAVSMMPLLAGGSGRPVASEELLTPTTMQASIDATLCSLRTRDWKWIATHDRTIGNVREELYHLGSDPAETRDLLLVSPVRPSLPPDLCRAIRAARARLERNRAEPETVRISTRASEAPAPSEFCD